jgi:hypothetical protein
MDFNVATAAPMSDAELDLPGTVATDKVLDFLVEWVMAVV